jgi:hypothetical protein
MSRIGKRITTRFEPPAFELLALLPRHALKRLFQESVGNSTKNFQVNNVTPSRSRAPTKLFRGKIKEVK